MQDKNYLLYQLNKPKKPTKEGSLSYVLLEYPFASVLTVSRGHPSLVYLIITHHIASRGKFSIASQAIPLVVALHGNA
jgi:hypothetical protein